MTMQRLIILFAFCFLFGLILGIGNSVISVLVCIYLLFVWFQIDKEICIRNQKDAENAITNT